MKNKKVYPLIPFKCPNGDFSCPYVNTMTSTLDVDCKSCVNYVSKNVIDSVYYDNKLTKNLIFFKSNLKSLLFVFFVAIGYQCYISNHFLTFIFISLIVAFNIFVFKFIKGAK